MGRRGAHRGIGCGEGTGKTDVHLNICQGNVYSEDGSGKNEERGGERETGTYFAKRREGPASSRVRRETLTGGKGRLPTKGKSSHIVVEEKGGSTRIKAAGSDWRNSMKIS